MSIHTLIEASRRYGGNPDFVLGGGGNTSWKNTVSIFVKASGVALSSIDENGFVALDLEKVRKILEQEFPDDPALREEKVLSTLMSARHAGQTMRPSVETVLHALFPYAFVIHTHPALVNGLLCSANSHGEAERLFGREALWVPYTTPGYVLSKTLHDRFDSLKSEGKTIPHIVFLQNHGVFVAADSVSEIDMRYDLIFDTLRKEIHGVPDFSDAGTAAPEADAYAKAISAMATDSFIKFETNREILKYTDSESAFAPLSGAFTPDHIVYAGAKPLFVERPRKQDDIAGAVRSAWQGFAEREKVIPRIVAIERLGVFSAGKTEKAAELALQLFVDAIKIASYSESFGGPHHMAPDDVEFIKKWEVEQYRSSIAARQR